MAYELFDIQTRTCITNSLQIIDSLVDQNDNPRRDNQIHEQVMFIRELVGMARYVQTDDLYGTVESKR